MVTINYLTLNPTALTRAEKGLRWLQEEGPRHNLDWRRINLDTLNISNPYRCALAQASGTFSYAGVLMELCRAGVIGSRLDGAWVTEHGFVADPWFGLLDYQLTYAWRHVLAHEHELIARAAMVLQA